MSEALSGAQSSNSFLENIDKENKKIMKTNNQMKPLAKFIAASLAVGSMAGFGAQALAQTAAGTLIKNLATVTYEDENGNSYSAQSNEAVVTVAPVYSASIESDNALTGAPGQTVYFPHVVSNTGNIADTYTLATDTGALIYLDTNGNGQPDPGELPVTSVDIPLGEQVNLVIAVPVPTTATSGTVINTKITATSSNLVDATTNPTGAVSDLTDATGGSDNAQGTNDDTITVSTGPVLVLNKSSVHNEADNTVTYTLTVKNTGGSAATNVDIMDPLPKVDTDGDGILDTQLSFVSVQVNGLIGANGDTVPTGVGSVDEVALGYDANGDGVSETLDAIVAQDASLPANTTVSIVYTASYDTDSNTATPITWDAGTEIENTFIASSDEITTPVTSNTTSDVIPQNFAVLADDTNSGAADGVNDGGDDDATDNDIQTVDSVPTGADVLFQHTITNNGNGEDAFNVDVESNATDGFPSGTVFTYWDSTGTVQLTDSDNDGVPDTGILDAGETTTIMVKANLPAGVSGTPTNGYNATLTATSSADPSSTPVTDDTALKLESIAAASVDIIITGAAQGRLGFDDFDPAVNAQDEGPVALETTTMNSVVTFPLELANESGNPDSFFLEASNVPAGWDVVFKDAAGNVITTTPLVPGNGTFAYTAEVTVSAVASEALSVSNQPGTPLDGIDAADDGTVIMSGDGDVDYQMNFTAKSTSTTTMSDTVTASVDIEPMREVVITPNGQNQVQPGGTVEYSHELENNGNQTETVELTPDPTTQQPGWTTVITTPVDTDNDGIADSEAILNAPPVGTTIIVIGVDEDGNPVEIEVTDADGDGIPELNLEPGENLPMTTTVSAPSDAPLGATDVSTLVVTDADTSSPTVGDTLATSEDQTTVMLGQVRLDKKAAIDTDCDGTPDGAGATFVADQLTQVEPGQCVVWQLTAVNEGTATVKNVKISDAAPAFTDFLTGVAGSIKFCQGNTCTPVTVTEASDADGGTYSAGLVSFFATGGTGADPANGVGGELVAGETMTGEFTVQIQ